MENFPLFDRAFKHLDGARLRLAEEVPQKE